MDASLRDQLARIFADTETIAVVGASGDPSKPAHRIPRYLQSQGYRIVPVNPRGGELLGEPDAGVIRVGGPADIVLVHGDPTTDPTALWRVWRVVWSD